MTSGTDCVVDIEVIITSCYKLSAIRWYGASFHKYGNIDKNKYFLTNFLELNIYFNSNLTKEKKITHHFDD